MTLDLTNRGLLKLISKFKKDPLLTLVRFFSGQNRPEACFDFDSGLKKWNQLLLSS